MLYYWHSMGNKFLTAFSNWFTNLNLTDMEVCYKVFRREVLAAITIKCDRFGFEPEITAKVAKVRPRLRIYEVGVAYYGRSYEEGKKITWRERHQGHPHDHPLPLRRLTSRDGKGRGQVVDGGVTSPQLLSV